MRNGFLARICSMQQVSTKVTLLKPLHKYYEKRFRIRKRPVRIANNNTIWRVLNLYLASTLS